VRKALIALISRENDLDVVAAAVDAEEAVDLAREHRPDVALIDYKMPGGGGPRAVREIREVSPQTRVVALSAYDDRTSVINMIRAGAAGYIVKGAAADEILKMIHAAAKGQAALSAEVADEVVRELAEHLERADAQAAAQRHRASRVRLAIEDPATIGIAHQPIVHLGTRAVVGFEALARFRLEPVTTPDAWFADAAAAGLRPELEVAGLLRAIATVGEIPADTFLSVNISPDCLTTSRVLDVLQDVPLHRLVLELTEHARVDDYDRLSVVIEDLRDAGARIAIDDAGAGFASLRHVLRVSPDVLKVDGGLIAAIETTRGARALTRALVSFAREMEQIVIAEGVERAATVENLCALGVDYAQGYHFGRPQDVECRS
jgi:EAL domain-containing protein (putative c-di-GMP-specific phosphodiesterase class I)/CheY-like chemotaxis protein